jgi:hypothetical protein
MSRFHVSKSTKRRRYLEEVETVDFITENQSGEQFLPQSNSSQINIPDLVTESKHLSSFNSDVNIINNISEGTFSNIIDLDVNILDQLECDYYSSDSDYECMSNENKNFFDYDIYILKLLANWTVENNITLSVFSALLKILKNHSCFDHFPIDARTVLKTNNSCEPNKIKMIQSGYYYHFGVANGLKSHCNFSYVNENIIKLVIGIDGLPLTKSSSSTFWPILGYAQSYSKILNVFLIGLYWGKEKPSSSNLFLNNLVDELKYLPNNGIDTAFGKKIVKVVTFCCDTPAKSFILYTKGHVGYHSCPRCTVDGVRVNNTLSFLGTNFSKRTHFDFLNRTDDEHHVGDTVSILTQIPYINMVDDFSIQPQQ